MLIECRKCGKSKPWNHKAHGPLRKQWCVCGANEWNRASGLPAAAKQPPGAPIPAQPRPELKAEPEPPGPHVALRRFRTQAEACERTRCPRGHLKHCAGSVCADFRAVPIAEPQGPGIAGSILACACDSHEVRAAKPIGFVASGQQAARRIATVIEAVTKAGYAPQGGAQ